MAGVKGRRIPYSVLCLLPVVSLDEWRRHGWHCGGLPACLPSWWGKMDCARNWGMDRLGVKWGQFAVHGAMLPLVTIPLE